jgi:ATP-dependent DNA helicase RecG
MENIKKAESLINKVLAYDDTTLERTKNIGNLLYNLLKSYLPKTILTDCKNLDTFSGSKKRAFLKYLLKILKELEGKLELKASKTESSVKTKGKTKKTEKTVKTLPRKEFKEKKLKDLKILKPIEKRALKRVSLENVEDVFFFPPKKYEDKRFKSLAKINNEEYGLFKLKVEGIKKLKQGKLKTLVILKDGKHTLKTYFVHDKPFLFSFFRKGKEVIIYGKVNKYGKELSIIQPEIYTEIDPIIHNRIVPVYSLKGDSSIKISSQTINHLRRAVYKILKEYLKFYPEYIPSYILEKYNLPSIQLSIKNVHFPSDELKIEDLNAVDTPYQRRLIFDELFILQLAQGYRKNLIKSEPAEKINVSEKFLEEFEEKLPFKLTDDQKKAIRDILQDISKPVPMNRLVQGDVGSGKTIVAIASALATALDGKQVAVMAPTEILAKQHYKNFVSILSKFGVDVYLLTGSTPKKEKKKIYELMESGEAKVVVGTHALIQDEVRFKNLSLIIVDEQHRFGVIQRKALMEKSHKIPHTLIMTATPIPRTMQIASFGDLDVSLIKQMPAGRKPVKTILLYDDEKDSLYRDIRRELDKGRQVFVVYPLIEASEKIDLKSAEEGYQHWKEAFPDKKVIMLHGKMSQEEKDKIMDAFKNGLYDILVSTTVIEVGVDVPNASVMVIEEAHRFGLSQIHQLRGRVGRGQYEGYCYLIAPSDLRRGKTKDEVKRNRETIKRLQILVNTSDGFKIAEKDLEIRGGGDIVGTAQSGKFNFGLADLSRETDRKILEIAKKEADEILKKDPFLDNHKDLKDLVFEKYGDRFELATVS